METFLARSFHFFEGIPNELCNDYGEMQHFNIVCTFWEDE